MKVIHIVFFLLIICTIEACTSPTPTPSEPSNYQFSNINCYLRYLKQNRELQAEMTFRTDSTIAIEGDVFLNDELMHYKNLPSVGMQYRLIKNAVSFDSIYTFSYTERDGQIAKLNIELNKFENLHIASDGLSKKNGGLLIWDGAALDKEDGLVFILTDSRGNSFTINHSGISKGNKFEIISDHVNRLTTGSATLLTTRKKTVRYHDQEVTKLLRIEYYLKAIEFEVKE